MREIPSEEEEEEELHFPRPPLPPLALPREKGAGGEGVEEGTHRSIRRRSLPCSGGL